MIYHKPVLEAETIESLQIKPDGYYLDGTLGGGGHAAAILNQLQTGKLIGVDQDREALKAARKRLVGYGEKIIFIHGNFSQGKEILQHVGLPHLDGVLLDLGVSSHQLDADYRGFSYNQEARLDMRMNQRADFSAYELVNTYSEAALEKIFKIYGEERWAKRVAIFIVKSREIMPIETTTDLVKIIKQAIPIGARRDGPHPATRVFQAIRIEVNGELEILEKAVIDFVDILNPKGRLSVISFHSLEDRIIKRTMGHLEDPCACIKELPCICGKKPIIKRISRKPIVASGEELATNPRARSAKLRVIEKL